MDQGKGPRRQEPELSRIPLRRIGIGSLSFHVADDKPTFWDRVAAGTWEPGTFAVLDRLVEADTMLLDLGAWVGPVTLYAAARGARVVAVEADPEASRQLQANVAANPDLAPRIAVLDRAVSPVAGTVRMGARRKPGDSMSSILLTDADRTWKAKAITPAELTSLVDVQGRLVVKIDIEGGEYALLPALYPLTQRPGTAVLVSLHPDILQASGAADPVGATQTALAPFAGWQAFAVEDAGLRASPRGDAALRPFREWLFIRP